MLGKTNRRHVQLMKAHFTEKQPTILTKPLRDLFRALVTQIPIAAAAAANRLFRLPLLHVVMIPLPIQILPYQHTLKITIDWYGIAYYHLLSRFMFFQIKFHIAHVTIDFSTTPSIQQTFITHGMAAL